VSEPVTAAYVLPSVLVTRADLARIVREVEKVDNELEAQRARNRANGENEYHAPATSQQLADFLELNKLNLEDDQGRMQLKEQLRVMKDKAPVIHMTFAVEADPASLQKLVEYIRKEIHPQAVLSVGLQPSLVGGVYLRTPNHVHDFSIRELLAGKREVIMHELEGLV